MVNLKGGFTEVRRPFSMALSQCIIFVGKDKTVEKGKEEYSPFPSYRKSLKFKLGNKKTRRSV
jgi:hypothetical protein